MYSLSGFLESMEHSPWQFSTGSNHWISQDSIQRLDPYQKLSDETIIGCSILLSSIFPLSSVAIFRPHLYTNFVDNRANPAIWKAAHQTSFWLRDIWIFPIHLIKQEHWMIASIDVKEGRIDLFDSMGINPNIQEITTVEFSFTPALKTNANFFPRIL